MDMLVLFKGLVLFLTYPTKSLKRSPMAKTRREEEEDNVTGHHCANGAAPYRGETNGHGSGSSGTDNEREAHSGFKAGSNKS